MTTQHAAIPTTYAGVRFRSRLEARWAATFDRLGLRWEYEPLDLDGWIPDFLIPQYPKPLLVEIKPITLFGDFFYEAAIPEVLQKIEKAFSVTEPIRGNYLKRTREFENVHYDALVCGAVLLQPGVNCDRIFPPNGKFLIGLRWSLDGLAPDTLVESTRLEKAWREAGNVVQWRAPK